MRVDLAYGEGILKVELPEDRITVIEPTFTRGLNDERDSVLHSLKNPIGSAPLMERINPTDRICIIFTDITRATPNDRLIPWLLEHLSDHPKENITLLNSTGTHRPNTEEELRKLLTSEVVDQYRVINHECEDEENLVQLGTTRSGVPAWINRHAVEADIRIVTGFIEPHFFAGFSGGPKGIMPGVAGLETVMNNHGMENIGNPNATFGITDGNPIWEDMRDIALRAGPSFLLNVTLNEDRRITGVFAGDLLQAHKVGFEFCRQAAMQEVEEPFDILITTNSGYPLDMNLYQGVKGMSAAARIVKEGGTLLLAAECREGIPAGSPLDKLYQIASSSEQILKMLSTPGFERPEQWQAQIQAIIQKKARIFLYSELSDYVVQSTFLTPCSNIEVWVNNQIAEFGPKARIAVLPQGPLTIPYLAA
ncbi:MAG TPA: nickel-dependent lactate racemase [Verrucomicrobiales bacterium]|nr:nickel-dependent lactate racemase [Verrucomicrobiales bacterium]